MNLIGKEVTHGKFGKGVIVMLESNKIDVEFGLGVKKFVYPDVFGSYLSFEDQSAQNYINKILVDIRKKRKKEIELKHKEAELLKKIHTLKVHPNSQAAFGLIENDLESVLKTWTVFTGKYLSGYSKGEPRVPQRLNINSACLLTGLPEGAREDERLILGVFMVDENFEGKDCLDGVVPAHRTHRIMLNPDRERMLFWEYFSTDSKRKKWGNCEIKYMSILNMHDILDEMIKIIKEKERQEKAIELYNYFCTINRLEQKVKSG